MDKNGKRKTAYEVELEGVVNELEMKLTDQDDSINGLQNQVAAHEKMNGMFSQKLFEAMAEIEGLHSQLYEAKKPQGFGHLDG